MNMTSPVLAHAFEGWLQQVNTHCGSFAAEALGPGFAGHIEQYRGPALQLSCNDIAHARLYRGARELAASECGGHFAVLQLDGHAQMAQDERRIILAPGDLTLIDATRSCTFEYGASSRQLSLILPRETIERGLRGSRVRSCTLIGADTPVAALVGNLLREAARQPGISAAEGEATLDALVCLLRPALAASDSDDDPHTRLFRRAQAFIERHICEAELCPELIAREIGVSLRGLYRLFARHQLVVAQYIRNRRLDLCAEALRHAAGDLKLSALGYDFGFSDASYFSSAFKARFGVAPGEYRKRFQ